MQSMVQISYMSIGWQSMVQISAKYGANQLYDCKLQSMAHISFKSVGCKVWHKSAAWASSESALSAHMSRSLAWRGPEHTCWGCWSALLFRAVAIFKTEHRMHFDVWTFTFGMWTNAWAGFCKEKIFIEFRIFRKICTCGFLACGLSR